MTAETVSGLRAFLEMERDFIAERRGEARRAAAYVNLGDFVLREGVEYEPAPYDETRWRFVGESRACFRNALILAALHGDDLVYVEGYGCGAVPAHHAWCVERGTWRVVDPTWALHPDVPAEAYIGVPFTFEAVDRITTERGVYGVLDDWQHDWPLLQKPLDPALVDQAALRKEAP